MALFGKDNNTQGTLPEIEKYYESEKRDRPGLAWLLALASILGIVAVLIGVFFGGRWVYDKIAHHNDHQPVAVETTTSDNNTGENSSSSSSSSSSKSTTPTTPSPTNNSSSATAPGPSSTSTPVTPSTSSSSTNAKPGNLTNTGPADTVPAFLIATALGTLFYRRRLIKRSAN